MMCPIWKENWLSTLQRLSENASNNAVKLSLPTSGRNQNKKWPRWRKAKSNAKSNAAENEDMTGARKEQRLPGRLAHNTRPQTSDATHTFLLERVWVRHMLHVVPSILFRQQWEAQSHNSLNGFVQTRKVLLLTRGVAVALVVLTLRAHTYCNVSCCWDVSTSYTNLADTQNAIWWYGVLLITITIAGR